MVVFAVILCTAVSPSLSETFNNPRHYLLYIKKTKHGTLAVWWIGSWPSPNSGKHFLTCWPAGDIVVNGEIENAGILIKIYVVMVAA
ncbi:MAG: hypothetical protein Kow0080_00890 [Candidatus Promineifilaceae bacterium]